LLWFLFYINDFIYFNNDNAKPGGYSNTGNGQLAWIHGEFYQITIKKAKMLVHER
jgi:hypothetical protein